jgi:O-antigen/teichoic acid export membrane protein
MNLTNPSTGVHLFKRALRHRSYLEAISSSYLVMAASILVQIAFVPLYLKAFGQYQFGVLMVLLSLVNFAVIGIAWMSGGALRLLGEYAGQGDEGAFCRAFGLIKTIYVGYGIGLALLLGIVAVSFDQVLFSGGTAIDTLVAHESLLLTGIYMVVFYAAGIDRLALTARKRQGAANIAQLAGIAAFAAGVAPWLLSGGDMPGVMAIQIVGALVSTLFSRRLLNNELPGLKMCAPTRRDADLLYRLGGRTGAGFFLHGALVLALLADTALIGWLGGAKAAAEFYLVWKIAEVLVQLIWKLPESLAPYFVQMDVRGEHAALTRIARLGYALVGAVSLVAGVLYGLFGVSLVAVWVGPEKTPDAPLSYALAGGAIFWLGISRLPVVLAGARVALRRLNWAGGVELFGKLAITLLLFPRLGYVAVLLGINLVHALGASLLYFRLLRGIAVAPVRQADSFN